MLQVKNIKVYDLEESVVASGYAMRTELPEAITSEDVENGIKRMQKLLKASNSGKVKCHHNALCGIRVSFDLVYPNYISPEMQRYHFFDIVTSSSKMHRLTKMDFDKCCNKYVTDDVKQLMNNYISDYNNTVTNKENLIADIGKGNYEDIVYEKFMKVISNCPQGIELFMHISTNYLQLQTMYFQRKNHKLKEDWGNFCKFIEKLPYAKELIIGE